MWSFESTTIEIESDTLDREISVGLKVLLGATEVLLLSTTSGKKHKNQFAARPSLLTNQIISNNTAPMGNSISTPAKAALLGSFANLMSKLCNQGMSRATIEYQGIGTTLTMKGTQSRPIVSADKREIEALLTDFLAKLERFIDEDPRLAKVFHVFTRAAELLRNCLATVEEHVEGFDGNSTDALYVLSNLASNWLIRHLTVLEAYLITGDRKLLKKIKRDFIWINNNIAAWTQQLFADLMGHALATKKSPKKEWDLCTYCK